MFKNIFHGFAMAMADSVPGVSGGTVAFILGFYFEFIESLHNLFDGGKNRKPALKYLLKLGVGWVIGFIISVAIISKIIDTNIYLLSSVFLGLTIASIPFIVKDEISIIKSNGKYFYYAFIGLLLVVGLVLLREVRPIINSFNLIEINIPEAIYIFLAGAFAISATLLPGISGSSILLITGLYLPIIKAAGEVLSFNFQNLDALLILMLGIIFGIIISVRVLRNAIKKYREKMIYLIIGLVIGSIYAIIMGPTALNEGALPLSLSNFSFFGFIVGIGILFGLERLKIEKGI
ncbi:DUF368 domain-containing protein [Peptoniphilus sp.]|jgi:putative membrane protein|uniref:DUF368 domain-containing protein n=1 Tax=Peptoniphilus sp. TaxID=1971214 RepID=UPI003D8EA22D